MMLIDLSDISKPWFMTVQAIGYNSPKALKIQQLRQNFSNFSKPFSTHRVDCICLLVNSLTIETILKINLDKCGSDHVDCLRIFNKG